MSITIRQADRGMGRLLEVLDELERGQRVTVGVHADTGAELHRGGSGATVADVAAFAELGTEREAPRSYLRAVIDEQRGRLVEQLQRAGSVAVRSAMRGTSASAAIASAFARVGDLAAASVRRRVRALGLRDTGHLEESIEARLAPRGAP